MKKEYEKLIAERSQSEEKIKNLENKNALLSEQITNLNGEFKSLRKSTTIMETENENKLRAIKKNFDKEKNDLNKNINEMQNNMIEKIKTLIVYI